MSYNPSNNDPYPSSSTSTPRSNTSSTLTTTPTSTSDPTPFQRNFPPPNTTLTTSRLPTHIPSPTHTLSTTASTTTTTTTPITFESPLPPAIQRCLGDRSYDKRKNAALEIESLIKSLQEANNTAMIQSVINVLSKDFSTSMNANYRKGGLIGIAATAIGLMHTTKHYLDALLPPVLHCFDDPESRVRYYACESLYNIAKVARRSILRYFASIFDGLCKLYADVDVDVKNGAGLLDRLIKDIVTESEAFKVEHFIPLLQNYIKRTNPYIRQLLLGWITALDSVPDINMVDYLPDFLDGLFNMLGDSNREIRQAADSALSEFLREVRQSTVVEFGPMVSILVHQCHSKERLNRLTAISWLAELIHHPFSGGDALLPYHAEILSAIMRCISDGEVEIRQVAERTNDDLLGLVKETGERFELSPLLDTLTGELVAKDDVPTKMAALRWINMLLEKRAKDMNAFLNVLLTVLLRTLSDESDDVVLLDLQVLSRIALAHDDLQDNLDATSEATTSSSRDKRKKDKTDKQQNEQQQPPTRSQFQMVLNAILNVFASDRRLLETRGSLIIRKLCVLLNAETVYICLADALSSYETSSLLRKNDTSQKFSLEFISTMVQTLNLILLTAVELHGLRTLLAESFLPSKNPTVFHSIFHCWCHNPPSTFALCLLARAYSTAMALIQKFATVEVSVGFLMQIDKLVQLLESPVFVHLRLQLLNVESPFFSELLKSCYGLLMLLPQSDAFRIWNERLTSVCNLRDSLGVTEDSGEKDGGVVVMDADIDKEALLERFDEVMEMHRRAREQMRRQGGSSATDEVMEVFGNGAIVPHRGFGEGRMYAGAEGVQFGVMGVEGRGGMGMIGGEGSGGSQVGGSEVGDSRQSVMGDGSSVGGESGVESRASSSGMVEQRKMVAAALGFKKKGRGFEC